MACALRAVEGEQYLVAKGLPAHDLAEEVDFAKPQVEAVGIVADGGVDDGDGAVRQPDGCGAFGQHGAVDIVVEAGDVQVDIVGRFALPLRQNGALAGVVVGVEGVVEGVGPGLSGGGGRKGQQQGEDGVSFHCNRCFLGRHGPVGSLGFDAAKIHNIFQFSTF